MITQDPTMMALHVDFTRFGFRVSPLASLLFTVAVFRLQPRPASVVNLLALLSLALMVYVGILDWGPEVLTPDGLVWQVMAQKGIAAVAVISLLLLSVALERMPVQDERSSGLSRGSAPA